MTIKRITVKDQVYEIIKNKILTGEYALGEPINILRLSEELGTSNTPIRESLSKLETEGLVISNTNMKYRVIDLSEKEVIDLNTAVLIQITGGFKLCRDKDNIKMLISLLKTALEAQQNLYEEGSNNDYIAASIAFDRSFVTASGNDMLVRTFDTLTTPLTLSVIYDHLSHRERNIEEHQEILASLEKEDFLTTKELLRKHYDRYYLHPLQNK